MVYKAWWLDVKSTILYHPGKGGFPEKGKPPFCILTAEQIGTATALSKFVECRATTIAAWKV